MYNMDWLQWASTIQSHSCVKLIRCLLYLFNDFLGDTLTSIDILYEVRLVFIFSTNQLAINLPIKAKHTLRYIVRLVNIFTVYHIIWWSINNERIPDVIPYRFSLGVECIAKKKKKKGDKHQILLILLNCAIHGNNWIRSSEQRL